MKILVVDDEQLLVKGMKFNLENEGYTVETAYDGATAIDMAKSGGFDLIILDLMMPQVDGLTACMRIREFSNVPIIMLTARSEDADKIIGLESGADDYITKPFNILELKARIRALLRRANAAPQQKQPETLLLTAGGITLDPAARRRQKRRDRRAHGQGIRPHRASCQESAPRLLARKSDGPRLGLHLRRRLPHSGCAHPAASRKARGKPRRAAAHPDQMGRGVLLEGLISH